MSDLLNMRIGGSVGSGGINWNMVSISVNATSGNGYIVDTSGGQVTLTLPASPSVGEQIGVSDYNKHFETNNCIISRSGHKIMGLSEDFVCDVNASTMMFVYTGVTQGWNILYGI